MEPNTSYLIILSVLVINMDDQSVTLVIYLDCIFFGIKYKNVFIHDMNSSDFPLISGLAEKL